MESGDNKKGTILRWNSANHTERSDLGSPFGRADCPVWGSLRGSHVPMDASQPSNGVPSQSACSADSSPIGRAKVASLRTFCGFLSENEPLFVISTLQSSIFTLIIDITYCYRGWSVSNIGNPAFRSQRASREPSFTVTAASLPVKWLLTPRGKSLVRVMSSAW